MGQILKGIGVVLVTLGLLAVSMKVKAGTPNELLALVGDKQMIHYGTCTMDKDNTIVPTAQAVKELPCMVFQVERMVHYAAILDSKGEAMYVLRVEVPSFKQEVVWRRGRET